MRTLVWLPTALALGALPALALAAEPTEIASAFDDGDLFDLRLSLDYQLEAKRAPVKREWASESGGLVRDLLFQGRRHSLIPRLGVGVYKGLELSFALPVVVSDQRELKFDQSADPCIFPMDPAGRPATCIDVTNSTTMLPEGGALLPTGDVTIGFDAENPAAGFPRGGQTVFRGVGRWGLDQLHLGVTWAPMRQETDDTKPTWTLGAELRLSIGKIMRFQTLSPGSEDGVSRGIHEARLHTAVSKRTSWADAYVELWYMAPFAIRGTNPADPQSSLYWDVGYGQRSTWPQQHGGLVFGFEAIPWEDRVSRHRLSVELRGRLDAHFEGRGYSEMWEVFAYAGDAIANPGGPLVLDSNPLTGGVQPMSHPGVTTIENYLTLGGSIGLRGRLGDRGTFGASFSYDRDTQHRITWEDAGKDGEIPDGFITPDSVEVNPLYTQVIDQVGRRYVVDGSTTLGVFVSAALLF